MPILGNPALAGGKSAMSGWKFDRDAEIARLKEVAKDMSKQLKVEFVINPEKERSFLANLRSHDEGKEASNRSE